MSTLDYKERRGGEIRLGRNVKLHLMVSKLISSHSALNWWEKRVTPGKSVGCVGVICYLAPPPPPLSPENTSFGGGFEGLCI